MSGIGSDTRSARSPGRWLASTTALVAGCMFAAGAIAQEISGLVVPPAPTTSTAVLVELTGEAAARVYGSTYDVTRAAGRQVATEAAVGAARAQVARNLDEQQTFLAALVSKGLAPTPLYRATKAVNGLAYVVDNAATIEQLRLLPGVKNVHIIEQESPSISTSVPFIGAPAAWSGPQPLGVTGQNVRIGIIDTGVDYQHATFGGTGLLADYQANDRTVAPDAYFPNARVVGGKDFAGDGYTGANAPVPDNDPMDCNGHGTHVASTAAGGGVNADGSPYTGSYNTSTPFASMKLGPGVAPRANVYALRVFGCAGSTTLTVAAIEWAVDPNNDSDLSDRLDVINMSLGSNFGSLASTSAIAADNAARMGVIVVASAGNAGDTYTISGSPGSGQRVIATAATSDGAAPASGLRLNAPGGIAGVYNVGQSAMTSSTSIGEPSAAGSGQTGNIVVGLDASDGAGPLTTDGCSPLTNAAAVAGNIALIDRGTCGFGVKYANARDAGAIGVIIANSAAGVFGNMGGGFTGSGTIPAVMVTFADGNNIKANIATANATFLGVSDTIASFSSRGPRGVGGFSGVKPDLAAPGVSISAAQTGVTCTTTGCQVPNASGYLPGSQNLVLSGTSMAAPHAAGMMALLKERFPDRSVEELKAMAMGTSLHDVFQLPGNTNRVGVDKSGAGRIDPVKALQSTVAAFNADEAGAVNLAFFGEVVGTQTQTKRVRVVNYGSTAQTFSLAIDIANDAPGIAFSLPGGNSVTVPAGGTAFIDVRVDGNAAVMNHVRDASADATQTAQNTTLASALGAIPRHYLTNKNGYLNLVQASNTILRVPLYAALRPASDMAAASVIATGGAPTGSTTIPLSGADVCTGTLGAGPTCTGSFPVNDVSLVSPFELQASAPAKASIPAYANIRHVGVSYDAASGLYLFAVSTWGDWSSPTDVAFNIHVDNNEDGTYDRILFNTNAGSLSSLLGTSGATAQDNFINVVFNTATSGISVGGAGLYVNRFSAAAANTVPFGNNVIILAATPAQLGLTAGDTNFRYKVQSCFGSNPLCGRTAGTNVDEVTGPLFWNSAAQGLNFGGSTLLFDLNGATLPVTWNTANMTTNGSLGALLLHHHNTTGKRAQVVTLQGATTADLAIAQTLAPAAPAPGQSVTITLTATNNGPAAATGVTATVSLPAGLTYVSDTSAGALNTSTGIWTIGSLANGASASINIVATVSGVGAMTISSAISGAETDPVAGNNTATRTINVAAQTAIALTNVLSTASPILVGGSATFTLTLRNTGVDTLFNVSVAAARAPAAVITASTASSGSFNNGTGVWTIASVASGATVTATVTVTAPSMVGALTLTANASAENAPSTQQAASVNVISPATVSATKTVSGSFVVGSNVTYTVTLTNSAATAQFDNAGNEFTDVLPAGLTLVSASATSGTAVATVGTNTVSWNGSIAGNGTVTITIVATVLPAAAGANVSNQGSVAFDADGNGSNESTALTDDPGVAGSANPTVFRALSPAAITATKTVSGTFGVGSTATYTVTLSNAAASAQLDNPGNEFTDVLPAGLTLVSASASSGTAVATVGSNTVTWNGSVPGNGSVTITITATVNAGTEGTTISNQGSVAFDADGNGSNESTALTDDPSVAGTANPTSFVVRYVVIAVTKTVSVPVLPAAIGATAVYTITLSNTGNVASPDNAGNELTDVVPVGLTVASATATAGTATVTGNTVTWNGSVPAGGSVVVTINTVVNQAGAGQNISNQASFAYDRDVNGSNESSGLSDDPSVVGAANPTTFSVVTPVIPTLSALMLALLSLVLLGVAGMHAARSRQG